MIGRLAHRSRAGLGRSERGYIFVTTALVLIPLLVVASMAIDYGGNYWQGAKMQRAADAAALAGVVWLPDLAKARSVARDVLTHDGWPDDGEKVVTIAQVGPRRLRVSITAPATRFLAGTVLDSRTTVTRSSTAAFLQPIAMGSPIASLANDPESAATPPQLWLNQSGPGSTKGNGDRYSSGVCGSSGSGFSSGCVAGANTEADPDYFYTTRVSVLSSGPLRMQVFDPEFAYTGDNCDPTHSNAWSAVQQVTLVGKYSSAPISDTRAGARYQFSNKTYCPGDQMINGRADLTTTFIVRAPDSTPGDPSDNPAICAVSFSPYTSGFFDLLTNASWNTPRGLENMPFWKVFRQWVDICTVSSPIVGDYITQVTTTADQSSPLFSTTGSLTPSSGAGSLERHDSSITTGGHNRYSLRSGFGSTVNGFGVAEFGRGRLPIFVNQNTSSATFYLAQLQPQYAGSTLSLDFFDIADTGGTATMTVLPPADSNYAAFPSCVFTKDGAPPSAIASSGCAISGLTSSSYDSRVVNLSLVMPGDYTCNVVSATGCWLKVRLDFTGTPADTTTWSASLLGDPVRLVE